MLTVGLGFFLTGRRLSLKGTDALGTVDMEALVTFLLTFGDFAVLAYFVRTAFFFSQHAGSVFNRAGFLLSLAFDGTMELFHFRPTAKGVTCCPGL